MSPNLTFDRHFHVLDYTILALVLITSAGIGFYYACTGDRQRTAIEFLLANRKVGVLPISLSLLASFISAVAMLAYPVEIYTFGTTYWCIVFAFLITMPVTAYVFLPVFYDLKLTTAYEYLEKRFNHFVRKLASFIFILQMVMYLAIVIYVPALALSQVTGLHLWGSSATITLVCVLYSTVGGIKGVMMTDCLQAVIMLTGTLAVIIQGLIVLGGFQNVLNVAKKGGRISFFNFDLDPSVRHTFWNLSIGGSFNWLSVYAVNQTQIQRYLTARTRRIAEISLWINLFAFTITVSLFSFTGLVLYAYYINCDPLTAKKINAPEQLLPFFVTEVFGQYPGLPGFFVAGIFSGLLSTLSSGINSLAAATLEDFIRPLCLKNLADERGGLICKILVFGYGLLCLSLVAIVEKLGNIIQATYSVFGTISGPLLGMFFLGLIFPWANSIGAIAGLFSSLVLVFWIGIGAQIAKPSLLKLPISVSGCSANITLSPSINIEKDILGIYKLSYQWYPLIAVGAAIIVGLVVSFLTGHQNPEKLDNRLLAPQIRKLCKHLPVKLRNKLQLNLKIITEDQEPREMNSDIKLDKN